ncbi:D-alanyl-D-alanine carboxypeptidase family protein [Terricaulis silvestris]|uniref:D-alanyl-D-alanine carboxypeptidase DacD n=1 Tax=Terricaulis silvestris TaxID=2686094 RepID=A0A6I6MNW2_9CAUL|nr:D-alanyl-D-alanine carboxypeptidase family protein [Terricaulis silvestris]QGZ94614.1 D-alanyl-D-alanine carboxypeptidase DacD precursor [Terricaulis silvestris]
MKSAGLFKVRIVVGALAAAVALGAAVPAMAQDRYSAIVMDARTNEVLLEDQADAGRYPASLTKMMTLYMIFEALERGDITMDTRWTASRNASRQPPSRLGLACSRRRGCDSITVEQAIRALVVQSANDVATLTAERLGGSEARFAANMTARARELGLTETRFANASGLPDTRHRTTARDMATLSQALWRDFPEHYHVFQTPSFAWRRTSGRNHNRLLGQIEGVDGIKTGYTRASGFNLATMAERDGRRVIVVVLGGESAAARDAQVAYLIEGAYQEFARRADPNAATFASLPSRRLDVQLAPSAVTASAPSSPGSPYATYQGMVVETLSPVRTPLEPIGQGDEGEDSTEESE